jgi:hypothetical protein
MMPSVILWIGIIKNVNFVCKFDYMDNNQPKPQNQLSIELNPQTTKVSYSNLAIITHSRSEFVIDFASMLPGLPKPEVHNMIIMNPEHAKRLFLALQDNINKYESQHGQIALGGEPKPGFPMGGFGGAKS